ncbi:hypothetical protein PLANPX_5125 [Lacipirellula parvula]|uniref:Uncharacterized protein n=1 Tax=Lacipirellula parvula TaxID=2650471 RepID=A0A5K7XLV6_9BACT|nr:hypothetical protein PLANPX_5125 [Lacipirellula parvula]
MSHGFSTLHWVVAISLWEATALWEASPTPISRDLCGIVAILAGASASETPPTKYGTKIRYLLT